MAEYPDQEADEERFPKIIIKAWQQLTELKNCRPEEISIQFVNGRPCWIVKRCKKQ